MNTKKEEEERKEKDRGKRKGGMVSEIKWWN